MKPATVTTSTRSVPRFSSFLPPSFVCVWLPLHSALRAHPEATTPPISPCWPAPPKNNTSNTGAAIATCSTDCAGGRHPWRPCGRSTPRSPPPPPGRAAEPSSLRRRPPRARCCGAVPSFRVDGGAGSRAARDPPPRRCNASLPALFLPP